MDLNTLLALLAALLALLAAPRCGTTPLGVPLHGSACLPAGQWQPVHAPMPPRPGCLPALPCCSSLASLHDPAFQLAEAAFKGTQLTRAPERAFASLSSPPFLPRRLHDPAFQLAEAAFGGTPLTPDCLPAPLSSLAGLHDPAFQLAEAAFKGTQLTRALERAFASLAGACVTAQLARGRTAAASSAAAAASSAGALPIDGMDTGEDAAAAGASASGAASRQGAGSSGGAVADWRRLRDWLNRCVGVRVL